MLCSVMYALYIEVRIAKPVVINIYMLRPQDSHSKEMLAQILYNFDTGRIVLCTTDNGRSCAMQCILTDSLRAGKVYWTLKQ